MTRVLLDKFPTKQKHMQLPGMYIHPIMQKQLDKALNSVKKDWDLFFIVDGLEGAGKSRLAMQMAAYCDPTFSLEQIAFDDEEFKATVQKAKKFQAVIFDEAFRGLTSRGAMSRVNKTLVEMMAEIRQKNLIVIIVMPSFFELDKYAAIHRSRFLLHVIAPKFQRGFYRFYSHRKKKHMYLWGKRDYRYTVVKSDFVAKFTSFCPVDEEAYKKKKWDAFHNKVEEVVDEKKYRGRDIALYILHKKFEWPKGFWSKLSVKTGYAPDYLSRHIREVKKWLISRGLIEAEEEKKLKI